jgi:ATP-binding cassette subfamily B protein
VSDAAYAREEELGKAYDLRLMRRLWGYLRPHRRLFLLAMAALPLTSAAMLAQPYILKVAIDDYIAKGDAPGLGFVALLFGGAMVAEYVFYYVQYYLTMLVAQRSLADMRREIFAHVQRLPASYFDRNPVGRVVTRMTTDVDVINEMFAAGVISIVMDLLTLVGIIAIMAALDWRLALVTMALLPIMALAINFFRVAARSNYRVVRERIARINAFLQEAISGMRVIQLFAREPAMARRFQRFNDDHRRANHTSNIYEASLFSLVEAVNSISFALVVWYGGWQILGGALALGTLVAFFEYVQKFFVPIRDFSSKYAVMQSAMTAAERVFQLLDTPAEVERGTAVAGPAARSGGIEFEDAWFAYKGDDWVLRGVRLRIEPGETVAFVGATGAGKTTIVRLLNRFYDLRRGRILLDGLDVREWDLEALRRRIGLVFQDVFLFSGTVADNITLGRADISRERVVEAARRVNAHGFISRLPRGYDEPLRERGNNLSTGQRQLIAFARALAFDPEVLVLDEATANVDTETEVLIQEALDELFRGRTSLVIAHRLSTIERADRIVVLHHGQVRETGTHAELLAARGLYSRLYQLQYVGEQGTAPGAEAAAAGTR